MLSLICGFIIVHLSERNYHIFLNGRQGTQKRKEISEAYSVVHAVFDCKPGRI
jgi:hypothetical protein